MHSLASSTRPTSNGWPSSSWWSWGGCKREPSRWTSPSPPAPRFRHMIYWSWRTPSIGFGWRDGRRGKPEEQGVFGPLRQTLPTRHYLISVSPPAARHPLAIGLSNPPSNKSYVINSARSSALSARPTLMVPFAGPLSSIGGLKFETILRNSKQFRE